MFCLFVELNALAKKRQEVWQTIQSLAAHIEKEEGILDTGIYQSTEEANNFLFMGRWTDRKFLDDYLDSIQFTVLLGIRSLLSQEPKILVGEVAFISQDGHSMF